MKFAELNLDPNLLSAIEKVGYTDCTPIQEQAMPPILDGKDVAGLAQTGTGKTAAFVIPLMDRILKARPQPPDLSEEQKAANAKRAFPDWKPQNFILILVPTRELAEQVYENVAKYGEASGLRGFAIYGGTGYDRQKEALRNNVEFIVATPGRLIDLFKEHLVDLKQVRAIVFDEADRMFDMGFKDDMKYILQRIPRERQFLVFSATLNFDVLNTAYQFGSEPVEINISRDQARAENVKDQLLHVGEGEKPMQLLSLMKSREPKQAIVFTNFKHNVDRIAKFLSDNDLPAMAISSLLTQAQRNRVIEQFKAENNMNIMVATDVAARGLDIKGVDLVVNYELPQDCESYVHRIGRTGRAGIDGHAFSLVSEKDIESLGRIEDYLKHKIEVGFLEDDKLLKDFKPFPRSDRSYGSFEGGSGGGRGGSGGGDRRPPRGGPRSGGGDRDRGPRRDGPDRGPRPQGASGGGDRPQGDRGPRPPRNDRGPRRDGDRPDNREARPPREGDRGPRRDGDRGPRPQGNGNGPRPQGANGRPPQNRNAGSNGQGPRRPPSNQGPRPPRPSVPPKNASIGQKVTGFFKKIFG